MFDIQKGGYLVSVATILNLLKELNKIILLYLSLLLILLSEFNKLSILRRSKLFIR
jgi:hypothetical protein